MLHIMCKHRFRFNGFKTYLLLKSGQFSLLMGKRFFFFFSLSVCSGFSCIRKSFLGHASQKGSPDVFPLQPHRAAAWAVAPPAPTPPAQREDFQVFLAHFWPLPGTSGSPGCVKGERVPEGCNMEQHPSSGCLLMASQAVLRARSSLEGHTPVGLLKYSSSLSSLVRSPHCNTD